MSDIHMRVATQDELPDLIEFFRKPEIDSQFVLPLSQRRTSIEERVHSGFNDGFWLIARNGEQGPIVGCGMTTYDPAINVASLSTLAVHPNFHKKGLASQLVLGRITESLQRHSPAKIQFDSWSTNKASAQIAKRFGFIKVAEYDDPENRPAGVKSVLYELDCTTLP